MAFLQRATAAFVGFLKAVASSCYDLSFYRAVRHRPARRAFGYLAAFAALYCAVLFLPAIPKTVAAVGQLRSVVAERVPDGTAFSLKGGEFSMTATDPIAFGNDSLVILDPAFDGESIPDHAYRETDIVVGRTAVFLPGSGGWERRPLTDLPDIERTKDGILADIDRYGIGAVVALFAVVIVGFYLVFLVSRAANAAFFAAVALLFGVLSGVRIRYSRWWATCLHAATVPTIAEYAFGAFGITMPYALPVISLLFVVAVVADERTDPSGNADERTDPTPEHGDKPRSSGRR